MAALRTLETLQFDNTFARLPEVFYAKVTPTPLKNPFLVPGVPLRRGHARAGHSHDTRPVRGGERGRGPARAGRDRRHAAAPSGFSCPVRPLRVLLLATAVRPPQNPGGLRARAAFPRAGGPS